VVTPYSWAVVSGSLPAGLSLNGSTGEISGTPTTGGTSNFTVEVTDSDTPPSTDQQALSIYIPDDLAVTTSSLPDGTVGTAYSQTLAATGGVTPYSWAVVSGSLPAGLSLNSSTGEISGTPTTSETANFTVEVTDSNTPADTDQQALSITINPETLTITTTSLPDGQVGVAYSETLQASGGVTPYSWAVISGSLPAGLSLNSSTGEISGTPTAYGTSNFTVEVTDSDRPRDAGDNDEFVAGRPDRDRLQRDACGDRRNHALFMGGRDRFAARGTLAQQYYGRDIRHADDRRHLELHRRGHRQRHSGLDRPAGAVDLHPR
jgi:hypothetical protein